MNLHDRDGIFNVIKSLNKKLNDDLLNQYWKGYTKLPFALYDDQKIYLVGHKNPPKDFVEIDGVWVGDWRQGFVANTSVNFAGENIGIVNLNYLTPLTTRENLYALVVHEMFHAFQNNLNLSFQYSEWQFLKYPITVDNLALRVMEREELLKAVYASEFAIKKHHIARFISIRQQRRGILGELINYELGIESREGTATYVESKAYWEVSSLPDNFTLAMYGKNLSGYPENLKMFRTSCYSSGMFICLLMDQLELDWQKEFVESDKMLYDYFCSKIVYSIQSVEVTAVSPAEFLVNQEDKYRQTKLREFYYQKGYRVVLKGDIRITGFNPMMVIPLGDRVLHETFLGIDIAQQNFFIHNQVLSTHVSEDMQLLSALEIFVEYPPVVEGDLVKVSGVGELKGRVSLEDEVFNVHLDKY